MDWKNITQAIQRSEKKTLKKKDRLAEIKRKADDDTEKTDRLRTIDKRNKTD